MKRIYYSFYIIITCWFVGCQKENTTTVDKSIHKVEKGKESFSEDDSLPLSILQVGILNNSIGLSKSDFIKKLTDKNVTYQWEDSDDETTLIYFAKNEKSPFEKYKIKVDFQNVADLDKRPYQLYEGVAKIEIIPWENSDKEASLSDYKKVFGYFYPRFLALQPNKKVFKYLLENNDLEPVYFNERTSYEHFIVGLDNPNIEANGKILWDNNYKSLSEQSSKAKNTPKVTMEYNYKIHTYSISIEFNYPTDFFKNTEK